MRIGIRYAYSLHTVCVLYVHILFIVRARRYTIHALQLENTGGGVCNLKPSEEQALIKT